MSLELTSAGHTPKLLGYEAQQRALHEKHDAINASIMHGDLHLRQCHFGPHAPLLHELREGRKGGPRPG